MARSSIQGASPAPAEPAGRDTAALGPSDTSDSGSDMMGLADSDGGDPSAPADIDDQHPGLLSAEALNSSGVAAGTGDSRSAGGDDGKGDGWDIGVDRVFTPGETDAATDEELDLPLLDEAQADDEPVEAESDEASLEDETDDAPREPEAGARKPQSRQ